MRILDNGIACGTQQPRRQGIAQVIVFVNQVDGFFA
jgi:hypothetical protein